MKNFEKYIDKIVKTLYLYSKEHINIYAWKLQEEHIAFDLDIHNTGSIKQWLLEEYKEPIKLTHDEYVILKNLPSESKYIVRDGLGDLETWDFKPIRGNGIWTTDYESYFIPLTAFSHLFQFIKWDEEPYEIAKLIADYESNNQPNKTDVVREVYSSEVETVRKCGDFFPLRNYEKENEL